LDTLRLLHNKPFHSTGNRHGVPQSPLRKAALAQRTAMALQPLSHHESDYFTEKYMVSLPQPLHESGSFTENRHGFSAAIPIMKVALSQKTVMTLQL
jgi:hypothetical protein